MVQSANARIKNKKWKYLNNILPTNQVSYILDFVRIVCALSNKFSPPLSKSSTQNIAAKMLYLSHQKKNLEQYVLKNVLDRRSVIWKPIDHADRLENFQRLDEEDLSNITCGSYQLLLSFCYIQLHIKWEVDIFVHREDPGLIQVKLQSRHVSSRKYSLCIQFNETQIMRPTANAEQEREL